MRERFAQQLQLGVKLISDIQLPNKSKDDIPSLVAALLKIHTTPKYANRIYDILEDRILSGKKKTDRKGLNLWQIFVWPNLGWDSTLIMTNSIIWPTMTQCFANCLVLKPRLGLKELK